MEREQTTIRLTLRPPDDLDQKIRLEAKRQGLSINQTILNVLNRWARLCHSHFHSL